MLESLVFMFLIFIGGISLLFSIIFILYALISNNKRRIKTSLYSLSIPIFCFGLIFFWYGIMVLSFNNSEMKDYSGTYINEISNLEIELKEDGTFIADSIPKLELTKTGTWKTGGVDGMFEFYDSHGNLIYYVNNGQNSNGVLTIVISSESFNKKN